jgi:hypothetical protein
VVVGSALVRLVGEHGGDPRLAEIVAHSAAALSAALSAASRPG